MNKAQQKLSLTQILILGILPSAVIYLLVYVLNPAGFLHLPIGLNGLTLNFLAIVWEISWLIYQAKKINKSWLNFKNVVFNLQTVKWWKYILITPLILVVFILIVGVTSPLTTYLQNLFTPYLPEWTYSFGDPATFSESFKLFFVVVYLFTATVGVYLQELYYRGYIFPRMDWLGNWSPFVNALVFSVSHLGSPYQWLSVALALTPILFLVKRDRSIYWTVLLHFLLNLLTLPVIIGLANVPA